MAPSSDHTRELACMYCAAVTKEFLDPDPGQPQNVIECFQGLPLTKTHDICARNLCNELAQVFCTE